MRTVIMHGVGMYYVYLLRLRNGNHYVGSTPDLWRRIAEHQAGKSHSTMHALPAILLAYIAVGNRLTARRLESYLKSGSGRAFAKRHLWSANTVELKKQPGGG